MGTANRRGPTPSVLQLLCQLLLLPAFVF